MDRNQIFTDSIINPVVVRLVRACGSKLFISLHMISQCVVRLVRACGSKHRNTNIFTSERGVRLVRACGSKHLGISNVSTDKKGQARKSLWIETSPEVKKRSRYLVRLVRACGSKQSVILPYIQTKGVRLVRACGSKPAFKAASL